MVDIEATGIVLDWPIGYSEQLSAESWMVIHTYPRQDKKVIEILRQKNLNGIAFFEKRLRHYPGKGKQESIVPLLPGYLFVAGNRDHYEAIYDTGRVVRIMDVRHPHELISDLRQLITLVSLTQSPMIVRPELVPGKKITIVNGTLAGCVGVIARRKQDLELVVNLQMMGTSVAVTLPAVYAELLID
jgi:transcriptional antiterminator RfaH